MSKRDENKGIKAQLKDLQEDLFHPEGKREAGYNNHELMDGRIDIHPVVFPISVAVIGLFIVVTLLFQPIASLFGLHGSGGEPMTASAAFSAIQSVGTSTFDWLLIFAMNAAAIVVVYFALSKYGNLRIGGVDAEKEFSDFSWVAMLFSAGMGIGLIVFAVSEPMWGLQTVPPFFEGVESGTPAAGEAALVQTFFHWGLAPWGIYALVGLGLAFFSFNKGLPLTLKSAFWPILGERIYDWPGHLIDITAVFATLFGLATSLGFGVQQANTGLSILSNRILGVAIPETTAMQVILITAITLIATGSVVAGLERGVKRLSRLNAYLMVAMLLFMLIAGPTLYLLGGLSSALGTYFGSLIQMSFFTATFAGPEGSQWMGFWTFFYWAWWIAWSPFVGMFIARISKGRTVREFVAGVLIIPTLVGVLWFSTFGGAALFAQFNGAELIGVLNNQGQATVIYAMLAEFPLSLVMSALATAVVVTIFITSSDSGSLVIDHITSGGKQDVSNLQRAFWALTEGAVASVLLIGGGLSALQAASIATGVPFAAILLIMCYTVYRGLDSEYEALHSNEFRRRWTEINEQAEPEEVPSLPGQTFIVDGTDITDVPDEDPTVSDD